ncbi:hypothetical protein [Chlorogloea sp. CCALA 695]|uniref:hypothetical protein n=1 Tax=Chlorogloea sp. CCALA 695 TaxID=2107693 RepID=UPI000D0591D4|nr:hypothetical protein [Chlorogloea sp. CCALA 695]PSB32890.1 hypothetical protein C7B70_09030 [Chlorogloea sp. CCALA 695]
MQSSLNQSKAHGWLDIVETVSVIGSIGSSIASIFINQAALASIPLSITVMLNLVNRRLQLEAIAKNNQSAVSQIMPAVEANSQQIAQLQQSTFDYPQVKSNVQENSQSLQSLQSANSRMLQGMLQEQNNLQGRLHAIDEQLTHSSQDFNQLKSDTQEYTQMLQTSQLEVAELLQGKAKVETTIESLTAHLVEIQEIIPSLVEGNSNLMDYTKLQSLYEEQMEIVRKVGCLREIDSSTQSIRIAPHDADAYYKRGLSFQALGDNQGCIGDFTEAIKLNSSHAFAYYSRGLAAIELGNKKSAVQDLREAAKLFFEAGDITSYQLAKDSSNQIHERTSVSAETATQVAVGSLFA